MNDEAIDNIQFKMDEIQKDRAKLQEDWNLLYQAKHIYQAADRQHHEFDNVKDMQEAMLRNFNPFDTFSLKKK